MKPFHRWLVLWISLQSPFAQAQDYNSRFYLGILASDEARSNRGQDVRLDCRSAIRQMYLNGTSLNIQELRPLLIPVSEFGRRVSLKNRIRSRGLKDNIFYHYFYSQDRRMAAESPDYGKPTAMTKVLADHELTLEKSLMTNQDSASQALDGVLTGLRKTETRYEYRMVGNNGYKSVLYLAGSPYSSSDYGDTLLSLVIDPNAKIIRLSEAKHKKDLDELLSPILKARYPLIYEKCRIGSLGADPILQLILEDSGVDLIHYFPHHDWFQLLRPDSVKQLSLAEMGVSSAVKKETLRGRFKTDLRLILKRKKSRGLQQINLIRPFREKILKH